MEWAEEIGDIMAGAYFISLAQKFQRAIPTELILPYALGSSAAYLSAVPSLLLRFLLARQMILCINLCFWDSTAFSFLEWHANFSIWNYIPSIT